MRYLRTVLAVLIGFALLALGLVVSLFFIITPERVNDRISDTLQKNFGLAVESSEQITLQRLPKLVITIPKSNVRRIGGDQQIGSFESVSVRMNPFAFFANYPKIDNISVNGLKLQMDKEAGLAAVRAFPSDKKEFINIETVSVNTDQISVTENGKESLILGKGQLNMRDISGDGSGIAASLFAQSENFSGQLTAVSVINWRNGLEEVIAYNTKLNLRGIYRDKNFSGEFNAASLSGSAGHGFAVDDLTSFVKFPSGYGLAFNALRLQLSEKVLSAEKGRTVLTVPSGDGVDIFDITGNLSLHTDYLEAAASNLTVNTSARLSKGTPAESTGTIIGDFRWNLASGNGHLNLDGIFKDTPVKVETTFRYLDDALFGLNPAGIADAAPSKNKIEGSVTVGQLSSAIFNDLLSLSKHWLTDTDCKLNFHIGTIDAPLNIREFSGFLSMQDNVARIENGIAFVRDAELPFTATVAADGKWEASSSWKDIDIGTFLAQPSTSGLSDGHLNAKGVLSYPEKTMLTLLLEIRDGELSGANLLKAREIMMTERPEEKPEDAFNPSLRSGFRNLVFSGNFSQNAWQITDGKIQSALWDGEFAGNSYEDALTLKGNLVFRKPDGLVAFEMPTAVTMSSQTLPVWNPDWKAGLASAYALLGEVEWSIRTVKSKATREFNKWWKNIEKPDFSMPEFSIPEISVPDWFSRKSGENPADKPTNEPQA